MIQNIYRQYNIRTIVLKGLIASAFLLVSCEDFLHPNQDLIMEEEKMYKNWEHYRSAAMGLYALQQNLAEQLIILGELRGDLLTVTPNATIDLLEVNNFEIRRENIYASPVNFYQLIAASNKLIRQLKAAQPGVLDKNAPINNYDRLYGEAICMRAWAYFNAVRIYGKVPYIPESLTSIEQINGYVNSQSQYTASFYIKYASDGYSNDTIRDTIIVLDKQFLNERAVIDTFTNQLENYIKAVGVNHYVNNNDLTWQVTVWNEYARRALAGQMYLFGGDYIKALEHFHPIMYNYSSETNQIRFGLDNRFANNNWKNILTGIDPYEHIYTLWFGRSYQQRNNLQSMFSIIPPNNYMLKPTSSCIRNWEAMWNNPDMFIHPSIPDSSKLKRAGIPGDFFRGHGVSFVYYKNGVALANDTIQKMLISKAEGDYIGVNVLMDNVDTVVYKYSINKNPTDHDANIMIFRAAHIHLYVAEIYARWKFISSGILRPELNTALKILNDGSYANRNQNGVRGRVGFANQHEAITIQDIIYRHDPVTNHIVGYYNYTGNLLKKQEYLEDKIIEEKAREAAFEGERFYDLVRIAKRREDPSYLADKIAEKFSGSQKEIMRQRLLNQENWYINYFD